VLGIWHTSCFYLLTTAVGFNHREKIMKKILGFLATGLLAFGATTASAIPMKVDVNTPFPGGSSGSWSLSGPSNKNGSWVHVLVGGTVWNGDIAPGDYVWQINGTVAGAVNWSLSIAGSTIFSGNHTGFFRSFSVREDHTVVAVPEPGTLGLLGLGLWAAGFVATRRRVGRNANQLI
jgi:hypothetical protein